MYSEARDGSTLLSGVCSACVLVLPDNTGDALMPEHDQASRHPLRISVAVVSPVPWQVRVQGVSGSPCTGLLGHIQRAGDMFEATSLGRKLDVVAAATIHLAVTSISGAAVVS